MADIKVREKASIKKIDKAKVGTQKIKDNLISIKDKADFMTYSNSNENAYNSPEDYATQRIKDKGEIVANKGINKFDEQGRKSIKTTKENFKKGKEKINNEIQKYKNKKIEKKMSNIKSKNKIVNTKSKQKNVRQNVKRTNDLSKKAIKTSEKVAKDTAKITKESIKASQKIAQATKELTKKTIQGTKVAIKTTITTIKAMVTGTKALIALLIAGGWVSVIVILVVCILGGIIALFNRDGSSETASLWNGDMVQVAESQIGVKGGDPYWSWYGFNSRVEWCACFVSWCAEQCNKINEGTVPKFSGCINGVNWYKEHNAWSENTEYPMSGDIIFFDWKDKNTGVQDGNSDHVGIVKSVDFNTNVITTIEGNSHDEVKENHYNKDDIEILGYGRPLFVNTGT